MASYIDDVSSPKPAAREPTSGEKLDDLFDYDVDFDDIFRPLSPPKPAKPVETSAFSKGQNGLGLGIDEEVEVVRKPRAPRVKLDEHRY
jgi:replication fork protection complex subunit Csm3/Swi3